ncbi:MAG: 4-hydroxy-tetrahydrodipicolinate reductase [Polyangiaceae bacterium]
MSRVRIAVVGASGRMGEAILRLAAADQSRFDVVAKVSEGEDFSTIEKFKPAVVIDFSSPAGTRALALVVAKSGSALVVGTTGLDKACEKALADAAKSVAVFTATNMSIGVHVLNVLAERAAKMLGNDFDIEIVETHHHRKVDAPSGTALTLAKNLQNARNSESPLVHGRSGQVGARSPREIGMHAVRGGGVIGDHTVFFFGEAERIELTHRASSRDLFASGALRAASWVATKSPGIYGMRDMMSEII